MNSGNQVKKNNRAKKKYKHSIIEEIFETILFQSRFFIFIPVLGFLVASIVMFTKGCIEIVQGVNCFMLQFTGIPDAKTDNNAVILSFIPAIDNYLFAIVLLIISMGLYELFISPIDPICRKKNITPPAWLSIQSWDELKSHIGEVIIMILIVNFFKVSFNLTYDHPIYILILGAGIVLMAGALITTHFLSIKWLKK